MATLTHQLKIVSPGSTGNQDYTGLGFTPKALIFISNSHLIEGSDNSNHIGMGFATSSTSQAGVSLARRNGQVEMGSIHSNDRCIIVSQVENPGTVRLAGALVSMLSDGFRINWVTTSANYIVHCIAYGGDDITDVGILEFQSPSSVGAQSYSGLNFKPKGAVFIGASFTTAPGTTHASSTTQAAQNIGFCDSFLNQWATSYRTDSSGVNTNTSRMCSSTAAINAVGLSEALQYRAAVTSFDQGGMSLNWTTTAGAGAYNWGLFFGGVKTKVGTILQRTSTGSQATTGIGLTPKGVLFAGNNQTVAGTAAAGATMDYGFISSTGTTQHSAVSIHETDNVVILATPYYGRNVSTAAISSITSAGFTVTTTGEATKTSLDQNGWTLNWTTTDGTQRLIGYLAIGNSARRAGDHFHF